MYVVTLRLTKMLHTIESLFVIVHHTLLPRLSNPCLCHHISQKKVRIRWAMSSFGMASSNNMGASLMCSWTVSLNRWIQKVNSCLLWRRWVWAPAYRLYWPASSVLEKTQTSWNVDFDQKAIWAHFSWTSRFHQSRIASQDTNSSMRPQNSTFVRFVQLLNALLSTLQHIA